MKGISVRQTPLGWNVHRIHYSADPDKDPETEKGRAWYANARRGTPERDWKKEYEINYCALSGQLVFPEFDESIHFVDPFYISPDDWTVWLACDPHPRTSHAFGWLAVNRVGQMVVPWSHWPERPEDLPRFTVKDYVEHLKLIHECKPGLKPRYRLMDVAGKAFNADEERNYFDIYRDAGVHFQPAKRNRDLSGYDLISEALKPKPYTVGGSEELRPTLTIMRESGDNDEFVRQFKTLRFREWKGTVTDKDPPEEPEQKERHLIDCVSYNLLDRPRFVEVGKRSDSDGARNVIRATK